MASIGRTLATVAFLSYSFVLVLEIWRPGFVTYFWNPQILLIGALVATAFGMRGGAAPVSQAWRVVFWIAFAIVALSILWQVFPPSMTRWLLLAGTVLLLISMARVKSVI